MKYKNLAFCFIVFMLVIMSFGCKKDDSADVATQPEHSCSEITTASIGKSNVQITSATLVTGDTKYPNQPYCKVLGKVNERVSAVDGKTYAITFEMRLPSAWNNRFMYQGNGGSDGSVVPAEGPSSTLNDTGGINSLKRGFAVLSTDAGHNGADPANASFGMAIGSAFGLDPQARLDYGYMATGAMAPIAKDIITYYYGKNPVYSYMMGCSNGGRHGMVAASRYPGYFDGILVGDPGFNLPKAAVQHAWDIQNFLIANVDFREAFSDADLDAVEDVILSACDSLDGIADGMVNDVVGCQAAFNLATSGVALTANQITALSQSMGGPKNTANQQLYTNWSYDPGIAYANWKLWKLKSPAYYGMGEYPFIALMGAASLSYIFTTPPTQTPGTATDLVGFLTTFNFDTDALKIYATDTTFSQSPMQFMPPTDVDNPTLASFRAEGGKMLIYHGQADPVFSVNDTINWYEKLAANYSGDATDFVRLFVIPGMNHCYGGCATDQFDALSALMAWVEKGDAPDQLYAWVNATNAELPVGWSTTRTRPLCVWPKIATYVSGDVDLAASFACQDPTP